MSLIYYGVETLLKLLLLPQLVQFFSSFEATTLTHHLMPKSKNNTVRMSLHLNYKENFKGLQEFSNFAINYGQLWHAQKSSRWDGEGEVGEG